MHLRGDLKNNTDQREALLQRLKGTNTTLIRYATASHTLCMRRLHAAVTHLFRGFLAVSYTHLRAHET